MLVPPCRMRNKTDRTDAQALAHIVRTGWFKQVHVKSDESYRLRLLLTHRRNLKRKFLDIENAIRHSIKTFGLKLGAVSRGNFEDQVRALVGDDPLLLELQIVCCALEQRSGLNIFVFINLLFILLVVTKSVDGLWVSPALGPSALFRSRHRSILRSGLNGQKTLGLISV